MAGDFCPLEEAFSPIAPQSEHQSRKKERKAQPKETFATYRAKEVETDDACKRTGVCPKRGEVVEAYTEPREPEKEREEYAKLASMGNDNAQPPKPSEPYAPPKGLPETVGGFPEPTDIQRFAAPVGGTPNEVVDTYPRMPLGGDSNPGRVRIAAPAPVVGGRFPWTEVLMLLVVGIVLLAMVDRISALGEALVLRRLM